MGCVVEVARFFQDIYNMLLTYNCLCMYIHCSVTLTSPVHATRALLQGLPLFISVQKGLTDALGDRLYEYQI